MKYLRKQESHRDIVSSATASMGRALFFILGPHTDHLSLEHKIEALNQISDYKDLPLIESMAWINQYRDALIDNDHSRVPNLESLGTNKATFLCVFEGCLGILEFGRKKQLLEERDECVKEQIESNEKEIQLLNEKIELAKKKKQSLEGD